MTPSGSVSKPDSSVCMTFDLPVLQVVERQRRINDPFWAFGAAAATVIVAVNALVVTPSRFSILLVVLGSAYVWYTTTVTLTIVSVGPQCMFLRMGARVKAAQVSQYRDRWHTTIAKGTATEVWGYGRGGKLLLTDGPAKVVVRLRDPVKFQRITGIPLRTEEADHYLHVYPAADRDMDQHLASEFREWKT